MQSGRAPTTHAELAQAPRSLWGVVEHTVLRIGVNAALIDYIATFFQLYMLLRVAAAPASHDAFVGENETLALAGITVLTIVLVRGELLPAGIVRTLVYRIGMGMPLILSYFTLKHVLPALQPVLRDPVLFRIDQLLFGGDTPAFYFERFNVHGAVEWFAFFYYLYFFILASHVLLSLFLAKGRMLREMAAGALLVVIAGHMSYTVMPGVGPIDYVSFAQPVHGGYWWGLVTEAVHASGAHLDIFPSLHTAFPTFFTLYSIRHRRHRIYRFTWRVMVFVTLNIIIATLFLRWHYGIDVLMGLVLAVLAMRFGIFVADREAAREGPERQRDWEPYRASAA